MKLPVQQVLNLFTRKERVKIAGLLLLMFVGAWVEALGIGLLIPFIGILNNPAVIHQQPVLSKIYAFLGMTSDMQFMLAATGGLVLMFVGKNCLLAMLYYAQTKFIANKEASMARALLARYLATPYAMHLDRNSAELIRTVTIEVPRVANGFLQPLLMVIAELFVAVMIAALLIYIDPLVALIVSAMMVLAGFLIMRYFRAQISAYRHQSRQFGGQAQKWANQGLGALKEVKAFRAEKYFNNVFGENIAGYARVFQAFAFLNQTPRLVVETLAVTILLLVVGVILWQRGDVHEIVPLLAVFALSSIRVMPSVTRILSSLNSLRFCTPALDAVSKDLELTRQDADEASLTVVAGHATSNVVVEFEHVSYRHPGMEKWILQDVSFTVLRGECVAIVGHSGAGKSTLADLLLGLLQSDAGKVVVDGLDVRHGGNLDRRVGYVPQHPYLLDDSVRRNVAFGIADGAIDDSRIWAVLELARLADKVRALQDELDTEVGERGVKLSGGERQRLSIARALYSDPDVVIFDEATSSLDQFTEREINDTINGLAGSKTLIVVTHRLAAAARCDRIVFLDQGCVRGIGKFDELYTSSPAFRKMAGEPAAQGAG
ncbi:MAG: ABC transporter ATP-binding protein [Gammaproteobacteria bacterium]|nr:ABC transporter ATP-binding protein [Gammaproteobacteria bacterium]